VDGRAKEEDVIHAEAASAIDSNRGMQMSCFGLDSI
jgi:hypothetical protein